jgi:hypothetical protein
MITKKSGSIRPRRNVPICLLDATLRLSSVKTSQSAGATPRVEASRSSHPSR